MDIGSGAFPSDEFILLNRQVELKESFQEMTEERKEILHMLLLPQCKHCRDQLTDLDKLSCYSLV